MKDKILLFLVAAGSLILVGFLVMVLGFALSALAGCSSLGECQRTCLKQDMVITYWDKGSGVCECAMTSRK